VTGSAIRVLLVDDHPLVREGLRQVLGPPAFEVIGEAGTGEEGIELAVRHCPDVVVLDINLPGQNGIAVAGILRHRVPAARILMLSVHRHAEYILESVRAGAHGYLPKDSLPARLRQAVVAVARGERYFERVAADQTEPVVPILAAAGSQRLELLTRRERDVLIGVASGKTNKEIAVDLGLGVRTVESYRESLGRKLGITSAAGLTRFAIEAHLLSD
jgi:DNA-binding NarL/FixJ family response regulator